MEQKKSKIFNSKNTKSIEEYCKLNNIDDVDEFVHQCFKIGYDVKKYGFLGKTLNEGEKDVINEVIREIRVEVPVEVIKEVEKIVEVEVIKYVDREIIKEVPVEKVVTKIEYICDKDSENELGKRITDLEENIFHLNEELESERKIFSIKTQEMENFFQNEMDKPPIEVIIEKIVEVENTDKLKMLSETLLKLRKDLSLKDKRIEELEGINKQLESIKVSQGAVYLKGSNITQRL